MLNFRNTNIGLVIGLILLAGSGFLIDTPSFFYYLLAGIYVFLLFYGSYNIGSGFYFPVICSAKTSKKEISISFDDGPVDEYTPAILQILQEQAIEAAFFCIGHRVENNEALCRQIIEQGHILCNHSYSHHFWFDLFSSKKMLADLQKMDRSLKKATGLTPRLFRPPYGVTNPNLKRAVGAGHYIPIGWNIRSLDSIIKNKKKLLNKTVRRIRPGAIFLFHDTSRTTLEMLPEFIRQVTAAGYEIVRLDKMLKLNAYA
jgi:peptidoglycan-N-acetylglucosamine deacetylase